MCEDWIDTDYAERDQAFKKFPYFYVFVLTQTLCRLNEIKLLNQFFPCSLTFILKAKFVDLKTSRSVTFQTCELKFIWAFNSKNIWSIKYYRRQHLLLDLPDYVLWLIINQVRWSSDTKSWWPGDSCNM